MRSLLLGLVVLTAACGGDDAGTHGSVALADFGSRIGTEYCAKAFACCTTDELPMLFTGASFTDEAGCVDFYNRVFATLTPMYQASVDAGNMRYSGENAADCVAGVQELSCAEFPTTDALRSKCNSPFQGLVANEAVCNFDEECDSDNCEGFSTFPQRSGICKPRPGAGEMCNDNCAADLQCQGGTCMALKADGASCRTRDECASQFCNGASTQTAGTCGAPLICNGL